MRSARMVLATATATAALAIAAPAAYADHSGDEGHDKSSYSKEHEEESKEQDKEAKEPEKESKEYEKENKEYEKDSKEYDKEHEKDSKEYEKDSKEYDKPHGGVNTGGGALTAVSEEDWGTSKDPKYDSETYKEKGDSHSEESYGGKQDKEWNKEKPRGGMHTGGGGLAEPGVTAGGLAALAVLGTGAYALRRKKAAGSVA
ncbi:hypothetical protein [Streptomyces caelestis]|uniref:hypothetical protein n=1 Tax=Streptomyces caelestis TaxID=36816 RepID=UPI00365C3AAA